jgi:hypothetical protein
MCDLIFFNFCSLNSDVPKYGDKQKIAPTNNPRKGQIASAQSHLQHDTENIDSCVCAACSGNYSSIIVENYSLLSPFLFEYLISMEKLLFSMLVLDLTNRSLSL